MQPPLSSNISCSIKQRDVLQGVRASTKTILMHVYKKKINMENVINNLLSHVITQIIPMTQVLLIPTHTLTTIYYNLLWLSSDLL